MTGNRSDIGYAKINFFYHPDHLGSTSMVTDAEGYITQNVSYIPYGEVFVEERNGVWNTPYLFNSKELDEETGLYYYGARYLNPKDTRWISVDPLFEKYVGMSPYNYCAGNPVRLVDVDGRDYLQNENGEMQYFPFDLKQHGAIEGENFNITINDKVYSGIYRGKTYDDGNYYWGLFGIGYKSGSRGAKIIQTIDKAVMSQINCDIVTNNNFGKSDMFGNSPDNPSRDFNLYPGFTTDNKGVLTEENQILVKYAGGVGTFTCLAEKNMVGYCINSPSKSVEIYTGYETTRHAYLLRFVNSKGGLKEGFDIINIEFSKENANQFMKKVDRLFPEIQKSINDRKKRTGF